MDSNIIVMIVTLIIWAGVFFYLRNIDGKVRRLEGKQ
ncbi:MAG: CcmD family protein [Candidatus Zixiibacteriota bacterium]